MEIPFTVKPRPDTGLWNAKVGIWLFLASEVMLFGGLFSGYLFLRLGAGGEPDYFWPKDILSIPFGFVNTLIFNFILGICCCGMVATEARGFFESFKGG